MINATIIPDKSVSQVDFPKLMEVPLRDGGVFLITKKLDNGKYRGTFVFHRTEPWRHKHLGEVDDWRDDLVDFMGTVRLTNERDEP